MSGAPVLIGNLPLFSWQFWPATNEPPEAALIVLNAGLVPAYGPNGLHLRLGELAAGLGLAAVLLDQSGKGESPARSSMSRYEALETDYAEVASHLQKRGVERLILLGLCSGADDSMWLTDRYPLAGTILLDPYCRRDARYYLARYGPKLATLAPLRRLAKRLRSSGAPASAQAPMELNMRDWSEAPALEAHLERYLAGGGEVLAIFTGSVDDYYAYEGQFVASYRPHQASIVEQYLRSADHIFSLTVDREHLLRLIGNWLEKHG